MTARVAATCISEHKGTKKHPVPCITLAQGYGIIGDAHAGSGHRQVSLLADESVDLLRESGLTLAPGDFAENILTTGMVLKTLPVGTRLLIGDTELEITQIGKECHTACEIRRLAGRCVMPTEGIFAKVIHGGEIRPRDEIIVKEQTP